MNYFILLFALYLQIPCGLSQDLIPFRGRSLGEYREHINLTLAKQQKLVAEKRGKNIVNLLGATPINSSPTISRNFTYQHSVKFSFSNWLKEIYSQDIKKIQEIIQYNARPVVPPNLTPEGYAKLLNQKYVSACATDKNLRQQINKSLPELRYRLLLSSGKIAQEGNAADQVTQPSLDELDTSLAFPGIQKALSFTSKQDESQFLRLGQFSGVIWNRGRPHTLVFKQKNGKLLKVTLFQLLNFRTDGDLPFVMFLECLKLHVSAIKNSHVKAAAKNIKKPNASNKDEKAPLTPVEVSNSILNELAPKINEASLSYHSMESLPKTVIDRLLATLIYHQGGDLPLGSDFDWEKVNPRNLPNIAPNFAVQFAKFLEEEKSLDLKKISREGRINLVLRPEDYRYYSILQNYLTNLESILREEAEFKKDTKVILDAKGGR